MDDRTFNPLELVESIAAEFANNAAARKIQICSFCDPDLPDALIGNHSALEHILRLLVEHAFKRIEQGAILVEALLDSEDPPGIVRFAVSDSRVDLTLGHLASEISALSSEGQSSINALNSEFQVETTLLGRATRIFCKVKLQRIFGESTEKISEDLRALKVFLVSNDPTPNRMIQHYSRHAGIDVDGAPTAGETLIEIGRRAGIGAKLDILLIAPPIEDTTPAELAKIVRTSELSKIKLLYIAQWSDADAKEEHLKAGFDEVLEKPFKKEQLFEALDRLAGRKETPKTKPMLLIVEDNPINAKVALFQVKRLGYDADIVVNGKEAVEAVARFRYFAVLMDLQMPVMDGLEATMAIRATEKGKQSRLPIIALTANAEWRHAAISAGCDEFLSKPATFEQLKPLMDQIKENRFP